MVASDTESSKYKFPYSQVRDISKAGILFTLLLWYRTYKDVNLYECQVELNKLLPHYIHKYFFCVSF